MRFNLKIAGFRSFPQILACIWCDSGFEVFISSCFYSNSLINCYDYSLVIKLILISNYLTPFTRNFANTSINTNKNYRNLNNANELKKSIR